MTGAAPRLRRGREPERVDPAGREHVDGNGAGNRRYEVDSACTAGGLRKISVAGCTSPCSDAVLARRRRRDSGPSRVAATVRRAVQAGNAAVQTCQQGATVDLTAGG